MCLVALPSFHYYNYFCLFGSLFLLSLNSYIANPQDFTTKVAYDRYDPVQNEACVRLTIVDSVNVELPESLRVTIELREPNPVIMMSPGNAVGYIEIMDDDGMLKKHDLCVCSSDFVVLYTVAVIGLERTAYYLSSGSDDIKVCVYISRPTTSCPISFPFDIIFRLSVEAAGTTYYCSYCVSTAHLCVRYI